MSGSRPLVTLLGSCVAVCCFDPYRGLGGMNHVVVGGATRSGGSLLVDTRYALDAIMALVDALEQLGGRRAELSAKLAGGAHVLHGLGDIGQMNALSIHRILDELEIPVIGADLGGSWPRKVIFLPSTGRLFVKKLRSVGEPRP